MMRAFFTSPVLFKLILRHIDYVQPQAFYGFIPPSGAHNSEHLIGAQELNQVHGNQCIDRSHEHGLLSGDAQITSAPLMTLGISTADCAPIAPIAPRHPTHENGLLSGDAQITSAPLMTLGISTADCVPIALIAPKHPIVGVVHAGWRGALAGVVQSTFESIARRGCKACDVTAVIGPCIRQESYEVSCDVRDAFVHQNAKNCRFFKPHGAKFLFDLASLVKNQLRECGVVHVFDVEIDTFTNSATWPSHRKASTLNLKESRRIRTIVRLA